MSTRANPTLIGGFVVLATALLLGGIIVFGSGALFRQTTPYVAFFPGSIAGLREGAAVAFRGVPIGQVARIRIRYDPKTAVATVPVYFEITQDVVDVVDDVPLESRAREFQKLLDAGLRAQLAPQSFVTGQLYIQLVVRPDHEAKLVGGVSDVTEVPTIPSNFQLLETELQSLIGSGDNDGVSGLLNNAGHLLNPENQKAVSEILQNVARFSRALGESDQNITAILAEARTAISQANTTLAKLDELANSTTATVDQFGIAAAAVSNPNTGMAPLVADSRRAAVSIMRAADQVNNAVAENRPGLQEFTDDTLAAVDDLVLDLEQLAQKLNRIADQVDRDPAGFFFGGDSRGGIRAQ